MPIVINDKNNTPEVVSLTQSSSKILKTGTPKFFESSLTGNGFQKRGHFQKDMSSVIDYIKNVSKEVTKQANLQSNINMFENNFSKNIIPKFEIRSKYKSHDMRKYADIMTEPILPQILSFNSRFLSYFPMIELPTKSRLLSTNTINDSWTILSIDKKENTKTVGRVIMQSFHLYESTVSGKSTVKGIPLLLLELATVSLDKYSDDKEPIIVGHYANAKTVKSKIDNGHPVVSITALANDLKSGITRRSIEESLSQHSNVTTIRSSKDSAVITNTLKFVQSENLADIMKSSSTDILNNYNEIIEDFVKTLTSVDVQTLNQQESLTNALSTTIACMEFTTSLDESILSTETLSRIYDIIENKKELSSDSKESIINESLRLLLAKRLAELDKINKNKELYQFNPKNTKVTDSLKQSTKYSTQQKNIILTDESLVIGQAGAGSGKSHTLIGRINYLKDQKEDLSKVLVLSFTNVAAQVINSRFPDVRSETLANMFNTIYATSYPSQNLSQPSTVANSLKLLNPNSKMFSSKGFSESTVESYIYAFSKEIRNFDQTGFKRIDLQATTKNVSNLIKNNFELTELLLNAIEQTTLEIQPIMIHTQLLKSQSQLVIPQQYQDLNFIITDESQDISTFEYILLLELTLHYKSQLLIIGDGSQTLYQFRNSDPRYLNALEASNVFKSYKLDINYRSNQEILTYANQFLQVIEANNLAKIQLSSNSFTLPTKDSFRSAITIESNQIQRKEETYAESIDNYVNKSTKFEEWAISKIKNNEQIAILAWTRIEVNQMIESLTKLMEKHNLSVPITNIMSNNERPMTIISDIIAECHSDLLSISPAKSNYSNSLFNVMSNKVDDKFSKSSTAQLAFFKSVIFNAVKTITQSTVWSKMIVDTRSGALSRQELVGHLTRELIRIETQKNAMDQYLRKNTEIPDYDNAPIIASTIHGAKGLEFTNTIVLFNNSRRNATDQESMRMFFVALSRAKEKEFIINSSSSSYDKVSSMISDMFVNPIDTAYLRALNDIDTMHQLNSNVISMKDPIELDIEND